MKKSMLRWENLAVSMTVIVPLALLFVLFIIFNPRPARGTQVSDLPRCETFTGVDNSGRVVEAINIDAGEVCARNDSHSGVWLVCTAGGCTEATMTTK